MSKVEIQPTSHAVAEAAASLIADILAKATANYGEATWVLTGGTTPAKIYPILLQKYGDNLDWKHLYIAMGDERCVPAEHPDSNWSQAEAGLLKHVALPETNKLRPKGELPAEAAAKQYEQALSELPKTASGLPRFDLVWLGMGEDGHTLSLFPGGPALAVTGQLVIPVHDSPKPPPDRISMTLQALGGTKNCLIVAVGAGKVETVTRALNGDKTLPIVQAVETIESAGGHVTWLLDAEAASQLPKSKK